jgi:hypothetical protein
MTSEYFTGDYLANYLAPIVRAAGVGWALSFARIPLCGPLIGGYVASLAVGPEWNSYVFAAAAAVAALLALEPLNGRALPGMCPNRSSGRDLLRSHPGRTHIL